MENFALVNNQINKDKIVRNPIDNNYKQIINHGHQSVLPNGKIPIMVKSTKLLFIQLIIVCLILADPRSYGSYGPSSASASNATWQVAPHPQGNSYGQGRSQSGNPTTTPNANSNSAQYSYPGWNYNQVPASQGPGNQYNYGGDSSSAPPSAFAYQAPTGYDHFSSDSAPPPNYNRQ